MSTASVSSVSTAAIATEQPKVHPSIEQAVGTYPLFQNIDLAATFKVKRPATGKGGGRSIQVDGTEFCLGVDLETPFVIKPGFGKQNLADLPEWEKLPLVVNIKASEIKAKSDELRDHMTALAVAAHTTQDVQDAWLPDMRNDLMKAKPEHRIIMMTTKIKALVKEGKVDADGKSFGDSATLKITGWRPYINSLVFTAKKKEGGGETETQLTDCVWRDRLVTDGPVPYGATKFFLWVPKLNKFVEEVPVCDEHNKPINFGTHGKQHFKKRFVSPRDMKARSLVTPIVSFQGIYAVADAGPTIHVRKLYIRDPETRITEPNIARDMTMDALFEAMGYSMDDVTTASAAGVAAEPALAVASDSAGVSG
jgi:hypothetical protein